MIEKALEFKSFLLTWNSVFLTCKFDILKKKRYNNPKKKRGGSLFNGNKKRNKY